MSLYIHVISGPAFITPRRRREDGADSVKMAGHQDKTKTSTSTMQHPNSVPDVQQSPSSETESIPPNPVCTTLPRSNWRWREMITAAVIVVDFFFIYSTVSLIGVFFPAQVSKPRSKQLEMCRPHIASLI